MDHPPAPSSKPTETFGGNRSASFSTVLSVARSSPSAPSWLKTIERLDGLLYSLVAEDVLPRLASMCQEAYSITNQHSSPHSPKQ